MPLRELSVLDQREAFVKLAMASEANRSALCRSFGISRKTGYKWLDRHRVAGTGSLLDRSRRPHTSPSRTDAATEAAVLRIRAASNNAWGARKIGWTLASQGW
jgi:transposase-like protein